MPTPRTPLLPSAPPASPAPRRPGAGRPRPWRRPRATLLIALALLVLGGAAGVLVRGGLLRPAPAAAGAYFGTLPPGSALPAEADCAARVRRNGWEPRPANVPRNGAVNIRLATLTADPENMRPDLRDRVSGNFAGTTDELRQFYACKWGLDEVHLGAVMHYESQWDQGQLGDFRPLAGNPACQPGYRTDPCPESFGVTQVRITFYPGTGPGAIDSTSFNLDYYGASQRACFEGLTTWLRTAPRGQEYGPGNLMGCAGWWYNGGSWMLDSTSGTYRANVQSRISNPPWHQWPGWPGYAAGTPAAAAPDPTRTPTPAATVAGGTLTVVTPLALDTTAAQPGQRVSGRVTWRNDGAAPLALQDGAITLRLPGAANGDAPYLDFAPRLGTRTLAPGEVVTLAASFTLPADAPPGTWRAFATANDGQWRDNPPAQDIPLAVGTGATAPTPAATATKPPAPTAAPTQPTAGVVTGFTVGGGDLIVYDNTVGAGFWDGSYGYAARNACDAAAHATPGCAYAIALNGWGGLNFGKEGGFATAGFGHVAFAVHTHGQPLTALAVRLTAYPGGAQLGRVALTQAHITATLAGGWVQVAVPLAQLNPGNAAAYTLQLQNATASPLATIHVDALRLVPGASPTATATPPATPTATATRAATATPPSTPTPTAAATATPTAAATPSPTQVPAATSTATPTPAGEKSATPTPRPTKMPRPKGR